MGIIGHFKYAPALLLLQCALLGVCTAAPPGELGAGVFMMPPPASAVGDTATFASASSRMSSAAAAATTSSAVASQQPPAAPPPSLCMCDATTVSAPRTANATFTNTTSDPRLLNATVSASWASLYVAPLVILPNNTEDYVFFQAQILFSHPVQYINSVQIRFYTNALTSVLSSVAPELADVTAPTCNGGFVEPAPPFSPESDAIITSVYETADCGAMYVRGYAPLLNPLATNATQLVADIGDSSLVDACGEKFPGSFITLNVRSRQVVELYALNVAYTPRIGPATDRSKVRIAAAFTQRVPSIHSKFFAVSGPKAYTIGRVRLQKGSQSYYAFDLHISPGYYGQVNVTLTAAATQLVLDSNATRPSVSFQKLAVQC